MWTLPWVTMRPQPVKKDKDGKAPIERVLQTVLVRIPPQLLRWPNDPGYYSGQTLNAWQVLAGAYAVPVSHGRSAGWLGRSVTGDVAVPRWAHRTVTSKRSAVSSTSAQRKPLLNPPIPPVLILFIMSRLRLNVLIRPATSCN